MKIKMKKKWIVDGKKCKRGDVVDTPAGLELIAMDAASQFDEKETDHGE